MTSVSPPAAADMVVVAAEYRERTVLIAGNPNVGKTTLYNHLTGEDAQVSNYPGVTVERRVASLVLGEGAPPAKLVDLPGIYSLSAHSKDEQVAIDATLGFAGNRPPDLCLLVVNAGQLVRNLYLALQLIELEVPVLIALNMVDEAGPLAPSPHALRHELGVPCVATNGRTREGIAELRDALRASLEHKPRGTVEVRYPERLVVDLERIVDVLPKSWRRTVGRDRALALWALTSIDEDDELGHIPAELRARVLAVQSEARLVGRDLDLEIIGTRYEKLESLTDRLSSYAPPVLTTGAHPPPRRPTSKARPPAEFTERLDRVLLHPVFGMVIFVSVMLLLFQSLFAWADPAIGLIEALFGGIQAFAIQNFADGFLRDLIVEGAIGGVGNVVVFLPQIMLLFLAIGLLESSGYMARAAYLMDRVMRSVGLHGRAFIPMLSGLACAVPAIMATRTMERERDRLLTMMVVPLMTCSARLPVYGLLIAALFPPTSVFGLPVQGMLMTGMYLFSLIMTLIAAAVLGRTAIRGRRVPLILELPPYRIPSVGNSLRAMWTRSKVFLTEAGSAILGFTIALWLLCSFPKLDATATVGVSPEATRAAALEHSYAGQLGRAIEPAIAPLGFDWKIGVGIVGAFAAREVFVSTMGLVYGIGEVDSEQAARPLRDKIRAETRADGQPVYTPLVGLSLMVFFALACQCMSTLAAVKRETKSWRWPAFLFAYMTGLAWLASFAIYQTGKLLGFG